MGNNPFLPLGVNPFVCDCKQLFSLMQTAGTQHEPANDGLQHFAVGVHPKAQTKTVIGQAVSGDAMVQIWSTPSGRESKLTSISTALPQMQLGLCHQGGLTWDCKWCPSDTSTQHTSNMSLPRSVEDFALLLLVSCLLHACPENMQT